MSDTAESPSPGTSPAELDPTALAPEDAAAVQRWLLTLADTKRILGLRYSDWLLGAPSLEASIAASAMSQDEWGHARLLYAALKDLGRDPVEVEHARPADAYTSVDCLDGPLEDWAEVVAATAVVDGALSVALDAARRGAYTSVAGRAAKMLAEEEFHGAFAQAWVRKLAEGSAEARERLRGAVERMWPSVLHTMAPEDAAHRRVVALGITDSAALLRRSIVEKVGPLVKRAGVEPSPEPDPHAEWDAARGRGPGHPDDEVVERARGDRNRALFVE